MRLLAFDTETYLITPTDSAPKPVCCTWFDGTDRSITHPSDMTTRMIFADPSIIYIGQSIAYDLVLMMRWHPDLIPDIIRALDEGRVFDTAMRERMLHLASTGSTGYNMFPSLADLTMKYLNLDISGDKKGDDIWRLKYGTLDGVPFRDWPSEALRYAMDDAVHTYNVFQAQGGVNAIQPTEQMQVQASVVLNGIGVWGFAVNQDKRNVIKRALEAKIGPLHAEIDQYGWTGKGSQKKLQDLVSQAWNYKHLQFLKARCDATGLQINPQEVQAAIGSCMLRTCLQEAYGVGIPVPGIYFPPGVDWKAWYKETLVGIPEIPMTKKGPSTSGEVLEQLGDVVPQFAKHTEMLHYEKMMKNYIDPYEHATVHPKFVPLVTTGRTGCRSPNTQNIPRKDKLRPDEAFRTMFEARKGRVLGTVDYSQLELCTLAATIRMMFPNVTCTLGDAIDQGKDVHCTTGGLISGMSYEAMLAGKKAKDEQVVNFRQGAKACNFGLPGGLGGKAFVGYAEASYGVKLSLNQAWKYINAWKQAWPEVPHHYLKYSGDMTEANHGTFTSMTITGRPKAHCVYTEGSNYPFQGLAADGAKAALWAIWRECVLGGYWSTHPGMGYGSAYRDGPLRESRLVNFVHDEIVAEHPEGDAGKAALARQESLMVSEMTRICLGKITISVEGKLSSAWEH